MDKMELKNVKDSLRHINMQLLDLQEMISYIEDFYDMYGEYIKEG